MDVEVLQTEAKYELEMIKKLKINVLIGNIFCLIFLSPPPKGK